MRVSAAAARRGLGLVATAGLVSGGMLVLAPVAAAEQSAEINQVGYTCESDNAIINTSLGGPQQFLVNARTTLPDSVQPGETIAQTAAELDLILPAKLVDRIRDVMEVTKVGGAATSTVLLQGVAPGGEVVGTLEPQVRGLSSPMVAVPASGQLLIPAAGTVDEVVVPDLPEGSSGLIYVQMPKTFTLQAKLDPPVLGAISETELTCERNKDTADARVIGTIPVGDGCEESECPLPTAGGTPGGGGSNNGGGGSTGGEDPPVIDPPTANATDGSGGSGSGGSGDDDDDDDSDVAPYTTTALPATGSPVGVGLIALLGVAAAGRIALAVRTRRRAKA
ncbi:DUF6801 domain-containing protein [Mumia sp. DW29H23]|uniref:DUF6801 domain-containing protein n=1 Tax=Mumia sp. DW29H23 TaxID=3421241 RepID=UPI003D6951B7